MSGNRRSASGPLTFGYAGYGAGHFKGSIDNIRIYSRELSSSEVAALYQEGNWSTYNGIYGVRESDLTLLIDDDFEDGVVGQLPAGWVIKHNGTGTADQEVTDQVARNGSKSFEISGASWAATITRTPSSMPSQVVFESWVRPEKILSAYVGRMILGNMNVGTWGTLSATIDFVNGRIVASRTGGVNYDILPFTAGEWYHVKMIADNVSKTPSFKNGTVSGEQAASLITNGNSKEVRCSGVGPGAFPMLQQPIHFDIRVFVLFLGIE